MSGEDADQGGDAGSDVMIHELEEQWIASMQTEQQSQSMYLVNVKFSCPYLGILRAVTHSTSLQCPRDKGQLTMLVEAPDADTAFRIVKNWYSGQSGSGPKDPRCTEPVGLITLDCKQVPKSLHILSSPHELSFMRDGSTAFFKLRFTSQVSVNGRTKGKNEEVLVELAFSNLLAYLDAYRRHKKIDPGKCLLTRMENMGLALFMPHGADRTGFLTKGGVISQIVDFYGDQLLHESFKKFAEEKKTQATKVAAATEKAAAAAAKVSEDLEMEKKLTTKSKKAAGSRSGGGSTAAKSISAPDAAAAPTKRSKKVKIVEPEPVAAEEEEQEDVQEAEADADADGDVATAEDEAGEGEEVVAAEDDENVDYVYE